MTLGRVVATRRIRAGYTQDQLADRAGLSRTVIQYLESGRRKAGRPSLRKVAEALGMTLDELMADAAAPRDRTAARYTYEFLVDGMPGVQLVLLSDHPLSDEEQAEAWRAGRDR